jgi:molybdate transport system permease protein
MDWTAFALSLKLAFWTCVLILPLAIVLARLIAWGRFRGKSVLETLIMLPLVLPPTVLGFYLLSAFSPVSSFGAAIKAVIGEPLVFTFAGILVASVIVNLPFAVQPIQRAFEAIPTNVREAAFVSGLSHLATMRFVELPLAWPGIVSALALVIAHTLGEFGVILMIGGSIPGETRVLSIAIYDRVQAFRNDEAAVMSAVLLGVSLVAIALVHMMARRRRADLHDA